MSYHFLKFFKRRPLWLCNDRPEKADDNGEVFFEYLRKNHPEINSVFVLNRNSPDWERLKKIGPVVETCSTRHKMLRLFCDAVVATQTGDYAGNELNKYMYYQDIICKTKIVFLRHGVTKDDLSSYLRKSVANLSGLLTTAPRERQSILDGDYGYSEKEVWLTGLPRHDRLYNAPKKKISIMPTWRMYLFGPVVPGRDFRPLAPGFRESKYRNFYHCLLNDERLLKCAKRHGYQLCFMPHPTFQTHIAEFAISPEVLVYGLDRNISYRDVFAETDLLVTDYSSVFFDFAYLKKPVIYAQFDKDEFFGGDHIYSKGYFDYERDGFGEVEYDLESTVNRIMEYMENNCQLKEKYRERIDSFFVFNDHNCCERVFAEVAKIAGKRKK